jgi:hypothetical protein
MGFPFSFLFRLRIAISVHRVRRIEVVNGFKIAVFGDEELLAVMLTRIIAARP